MTYKRLAYDDAASPAEMVSDSRAVELAMDLPQQVTRAPRSLRPSPQLARPEQLAVSDAAARLAGRMFD